MRLRIGEKRTELTGKAQKLAEADTSVSQVGAIADQQIKPDEFSDIRKIPLDTMKPDPDQPRKLRITMEMLKDPDAVTDKALTARIESITGMAATMKTMGQQTPIEVYRSGRIYIIVTGERRYWAARLAGLEVLHAKVLPERPARMKLKQHIENAQREALDLPEQLESLQNIVREAVALDDKVASAADLRHLLGMSRSMASRWWAVLKGPSDVRDAIMEGRVTSIVRADAIARIEHPSVRAEMMAKDEAAAAPAPEAQSPSPDAPKKKAAGRPTQYINFGRSTSPSVARVVLTLLMGSEPKNIDWNDTKAVNKAIKAVIEKIEKDITD